jgi:uncharacterized protein
MRAARIQPPYSWGCRPAAALLFVLLALLSASDLRAEPQFPPLTGRVVDEAGLLTPEDKAAIEQQLAELEAKSTDQFAVVTLNSLQGYPIEDFGYQLGRRWGIGQKDKDNGVLLIVAPNERKVRIEVGYGLEPTLTDALSNLIIQNAILPEFRRGNFASGIRAGVRDVKDVLLGDAEEVKARARRSPQGEDLDLGSIILIIFWACMVAFVIYAVVQSANSAQQATAGGRRRRSGPIFIPTGSGGWSGGGWSGGGWGGGGGGWSGGGGGFGGGGSSGSW